MPNVTAIVSRLGTLYEDMAYPGCLFVDLAETNTIMGN